MRMKPEVMSFFLLLFPIVMYCEDTPATISPAKPKIGDRITLTYNSGSRTATLRNVMEITAEVMLLKGLERGGTLVTVPLKREGSLWSGSFTLTNEGAILLLFRFTSGALKDDNGANVWNAMVYGTDSRPVPNSHLVRSYLLKGEGIMEFKLDKDPMAAEMEAAEERMLYPDNLNVTIYRWTKMINESPDDFTRKKIKQELDSVYALKRNDEDATNSLLYWFEQSGQKERAEEIRTAAVAVNPKGIIAFSTAQDEAYFEQDPTKRIFLIRRLNADFPVKGSDLEVRLNLLLNAHVALGEYDKAALIADSMPTPRGAPYNTVARAMIDRGTDLERAVDYAKTGIAVLRKPGSEGKVPMFTDAQWQQLKIDGLGRLLDTYALGLFKLNRLEEAFAAYQESYRLTGGKYADINQRLIECSARLGRTDYVLEVTREAIRLGQSSDEILGAYKSAYLKTNGSERGLDSSIAGLKAETNERELEGLMKERINKTAYEFTLKSLNGTMVKLSNLKGKVVVLDFWATWCGPCVTSFPYIQRAYDNYKSNDKVVFFAVNTYEHQWGREREAIVKKFINDNKYTFPVLFDEGIAVKYEVEAIPTSVVIDRAGKIQFRKVGSEGEEIIRRLSAQIDLLLNNEFYVK